MQAVRVCMTIRKVRRYKGRMPLLTYTRIVARFTPAARPDGHDAFLGDVSLDQLDAGHRIAWQAVTGGDAVVWSRIPGSAEATGF